MGSPFLIDILMGPSYYFPEVLLPPLSSLVGQSGCFALQAVMGGTGIALLTQSSIENVSGLGVRGTFFRATPQCIT